jgi:hypothetical protein
MEVSGIEHVLSSKRGDDTRSLGYPWTKLQRSGPPRVLVLAIRAMARRDWDVLAYVGQHHDIKRAPTSVRNPWSRFASCERSASGVRTSNTDDSLAFSTQQLARITPKRTGHAPRTR